MQTSIHAGNIARFYMIISWVPCLWLMFQGCNFQWLQSRNNDFVFTRSEVETLKQKREGNYNMQISSLTVRCLGYIAVSLYPATGAIRHVIQPCGNKRMVGPRQMLLPFWIQTRKLSIDPPGSNGFNYLCWSWLTGRRAHLSNAFNYTWCWGRTSGERDYALFLFEKEPAVPFCHSSQSYSTACLIFVCTTSYRDLAIAQGYCYNKANSNEARN